MRKVYENGDERWTWDYKVTKMVGPVVRLDGTFAEFSGSITVRPPDEERDLYPHLTWTGTGKVSRAVRDVAEYHWKRAKAGL